jgi:hypothetical protein
MSSARLEELIVLFVIGWVVTLMAFFLALWLEPLQPFTPFLFQRVPGFL